MTILVYTSTDTYATPTDGVVDTHARGRRQLSWSAEADTDDVLWKIEGSDNNTDWTEVQAEATLTAGGSAGTFSVAPPRYRYYRPRFKSAAAGTPGVVELTLYAHDYIETGTYFGKTVTDDHVEYAEELIDRVTHDHFASRLETFTLFGDGSRSLNLLAVTPLSVLSVSSATVVDAAETSYTLDTSEIRVTDNHWLSLASDYAHQWYRGPGDRENVTVAVYVGWATTPGPIHRAAQSIAANATVSTSENTANFTMEKIGDYTYQKSSRVEVAFQVTGDPEVDRILADYRNALADMGGLF